MKLRAGGKISVVEHENRDTRRPCKVKKARIEKVVYKRFVRMIHYRLVYDGTDSSTWNEGLVSLESKGTLWVVGWDGPQVRALSTVAALGE
jgi:hypothetical protein